MTELYSALSDCALNALIAGPFVILSVFIFMLPPPFSSSDQISDIRSEGTEV